MNRDLTKDSVTKSMLLFAIPMILGDLLRQCYNITDTLIVGQFLGRNALAAVGSSFTLMTFLTSILLGLCMGSGALCFHPLRPAGRDRPLRGYLCVLLFHRRRDGASERHCLPLSGRASCISQRP